MSNVGYPPCEPLRPPPRPALGPKYKSMERLIQAIMEDEITAEQAMNLMFPKKTKTS